MAQAKIGVIGGTGLYNIEGMTDIREVAVDTPFGVPSDRLTIGKLSGVGVAFLPRHGRGHRIQPTDIPVRANIYALKSIGVEHIIAIHSCGSFKDELAPGHMVIPDQIIDRTRNRISTFFGEGIVVHIAFAEPFCPQLSRMLYQASKEAGATVHEKGTYVAMEGPAFSTRAESRLYKSWGADIIGMTALPEAKLAREAEMCYASVSCVTDYDAWKERTEAEAVTVEAVLAYMKANMEMARRIIKIAVAKIPPRRTCECANALSTAIVTAPSVMSLAQKKKFDLLISKYIQRV